MSMINDACDNANGEPRGRVTMVSQVVREPDVFGVFGTAVALGFVMMIVVKQLHDPIDFETEEEAASAPPIWMLWAMSHDSPSGGAECIDEYESLADAQETAENDKEQILEYARELLDS